MNKTPLGVFVSLKTDLDTAVMQITAALKTEGFGVLTEIDVKETMKKKLGVEFRPYKILGACNPNLANQVLTIAPETGLLLPCNVTVSQIADGVEIGFIDPLAMLGVVNNPALQPIAAEARARLERVAAVLEEKNHATL